MHKYNSPSGYPITSVLETCPCAASIDYISDDGNEVEYDGEGSIMFWDDQAPVLNKRGKLTFLDELGDMWEFDQLIKVLE